MATLKYFIFIFTIACVTALFSSGCTTQRYTTKFTPTPMESVNEDLSIDPQKLSKELDDEMRIEDAKRREKLLEKVKAEAKKESKSSVQQSGETKE